MKGPEEWILGPGRVIQVPTAHNHQRKWIPRHELHTRFPALAANWVQISAPTRDTVEVGSDCPECGLFGIHYMLDIIEKMITEDRSHLNDQLKTETEYRRVRTRVIERECQHCNCKWYETIDQKPGTWYQIGDA